MIYLFNSLVFYHFFTIFALWQLGQYSSILIFTQQKYNFLL